MIKTLIAATAVVVAFASPANAAITLYDSAAAFTGDVTVASSTDWDSYGPGFSFPGSPFTTGDLTFIAGGENLIGGMGQGYDLARNLLTDNNVQGTTVLVAGAYDAFGFSLGNFFGAGTTDVTVGTNIGSYSYLLATPTATSGGALQFYGFVAGPGEYITSVAYSGGSATGATDFLLGSAVPEASTWVMLIAGFGLVGAAARRRRTAVAA